MLRDISPWDTSANPFDDDDGRAYPSPVAGDDVDGVTSTLILSHKPVSRTIRSSKRKIDRH